MEGRIEGEGRIKLGGRELEGAWNIDLTRVPTSTMHRSIRLACHTYAAARRG